jgi:exonuclease 3'-5' domain-containing protein 1
MSTIIVSTIENIPAAVQAIAREFEIAVDCEGVDLSRTGKLCLLQVGLTNGTVYIFDITLLGSQAFNVSAGNTSLKVILESSAILKIMFDLRNDSEALYHQYGVSLNNAFDVQLSELAIRRTTGGQTKFLNGLQRVIENHLEVDQTTMALKASLTKRFSSKNGFDIGMWDRRPLEPNALEYAAADVRLLFPLHNGFKRRLNEKWLGKVRNLTEDRLRERYLPNPMPNGPERAYAPQFRN